MRKGRGQWGDIQPESESHWRGSSPGGSHGLQDEGLFQPSLHPPPLEAHSGGQRRPGSCGARRSPQRQGPCKPLPRSLHPSLGRDTPFSMTVRMCVPTHIPPHPGRHGPTAAPRGCGKGLRFEKGQRRVAEMGPVPSLTLFLGTSERDAAPLISRVEWSGGCLINGGNRLEKCSPESKSCEVSCPRVSAPGYPGRRGGGALCWTGCETGHLNKPASKCPNARRALQTACGHVHTRGNIRTCAHTRHTLTSTCSHRTGFCGSFAGIGANASPPPQVQEQQLLQFSSA